MTHQNNPLSTVSGRWQPPNALRWAIRAVVVAGLAVDAWVHLDLAPTYDVVTAAVSEGWLFRAEAVACAAAVALLLLVRRPVSYAIAGLVASSALAVLLISTYVHVGAVGPLPDMYEPTWFAEKALTAGAEAVAALGAIVGLAFDRRPAGR